MGRQMGILVQSWWCNSTGWSQDLDENTQCTTAVILWLIWLPPLPLSICQILDTQSLRWPSQEDCYVSHAATCDHRVATYIAQLYNSWKHFMPYNQTLPETEWTQASSPYYHQCSGNLKVPPPNWGLVLQMLIHLKIPSHKNQNHSNMGV